MPHAKIMVVDDETDLVRALTLRFRSAGYEVVQATDGVMATQVAVHDQPDLIVLDIGLPGGDGHTVAERLRQNPRTMSIPVVYLTARNSPQDVQRAKQLGAAGYVTKPFDAQKLLDLVTEVIIGVTAGAP